jgi:hypothetical protein
MKLLSQDRLISLFEVFQCLDNSLSPLHEDILDHPDRPGIKILNPEGRFAGKLSIKKEAAGKLRVFAMVDVWTQIALKPIHAVLFNLLRSLPCDGTFNQAVSENSARLKSLTWGGSFGYDLSAATDRLPLQIQCAIIDLLHPGLGEL